jgi:hypothetical protein
MADTAETGASGLGDQVRALRGDFSLDRIEGRLEEAVSEQPFLAHLLDLRIVARAVMLCVAGALVALVLFSPAFAAFVLLLLFFGGWALMAHRSYDRRRGTQPTEQEEPA